VYIYMGAESEEKTPKPSKGAEITVDGVGE
jgi:hypothetical protein